MPEKNNANTPFNKKSWEKKVKRAAFLCCFFAGLLFGITHERTLNTANPSRRYFFSWKGSTIQIRRPGPFKPPCTSSYAHTYAYVVALGRSDDTNPPHPAHTKKKPEIHSKQQAKSCPMYHVSSLARAAFELGCFRMRPSHGENGHAQPAGAKTSTPRSFSRRSNF